MPPKNLARLQLEADEKKAQAEYLQLEIDAAKATAKAEEKERIDAEYHTLAPKSGEFKAVLDDRYAVFEGWVPEAVRRIVADVASARAAYDKDPAVNEAREKVGLARSARYKGDRVLGSHPISQVMPLLMLLAGVPPVAAEGSTSDDSGGDGEGARVG
jgi:hypothetical protein